jgi:hypothetical protein
MKSWHPCITVTLVDAYMFSALFFSRQMLTQRIENSDLLAMCRSILILCSVVDVAVYM